MAKFFEITNPSAWAEWVSTRPPIVQDLCRRYPPDRLYWLSPPGQRVIIVGYSESGTLTVNVSRKFNVLCFERQVFGIDPGNLTECDLPNQFEVTH